MVMSVNSNADALARKYRRRAQRLARAWTQGIRNVLIAITRGAVDRVSGPGDAPAGSYPVPVREGHLRRGMDWEMEGPGGGMVFNSMVYATVIHEDRQFLTDSAEAQDIPGIMAVPMRRALA